MTRPAPLELSAERGRFTLAVDESWAQGRGVFGGVVGAALLEAMSAVVADKRRAVRMLSVCFSEPVPAGAVTIDVVAERIGARVSHLSARMKKADEGVVALATATFAASREEKLRYDEATRAPSSPPFDSVPVLASSPLMPTFTQHFEYRLSLGHPPFSGAREAVLGGFVRPRVHQPLDAGLAVGLLDALPPAAVARAHGLLAASSVELCVSFHAPLPHDDGHNDGRGLVAARSRRAAEGYADQIAELWSADGTLLAECRQLVALL